MNKYFINTKAPAELLNEVIKVNLPCIVSIEGWLQDQFKSTINPTQKEETDILKRNTIRPKLDFWVFNIDPSNYNEFKITIENASDLFSNYIGIIHVQIQKENKIIFGAYDNFDPECTVLSSGEKLLNELKTLNLINDFKLSKTEQHA